jgi:integrase
MASLYKRPNSPFWWVSRKEGGAWAKKRTHWRTDCPLQTANAKTYVAQQALDEGQQRDAFANSGWVQPMINNLPIASRSVGRYSEAWRVLDLFMTQRRISIAEFDAHRADLYIEWRLSTALFRHKKISKNTACQELKFLKFLQKQARLRGKMIGRPMDDYVIRMAPKKMKPALTDEQIYKIRDALPKYPSWMSVSFEIGLATGARLQECSIPMDCINFEHKTITFPNPKGGVGKAFTIPIPKSILPLLAVLKASGAKKTCDIHPSKASFKWRKFFDRLGMKDVCFHCLRVTRVTRLRQAGVPSPDARRLVNHSSELIHRLYDRHQVEELRQYVDCGNTLSATPQSLLERLRPRSSESPVTSLAS